MFHFSVLKHPRRGERREPQRRTPRLEALEDRAVPTANLRLIDAFISDSAGHLIDPPAVGSLAYISVDYETIDLPAGAAYTIRRSIDGGPPVDNVVTWGAGSNGRQNDIGLTTKPWVVRPGPHRVAVTLDATNVIPETTKADNDTTFTFTPITFPGKFVQPLQAEPGNYTDWSINNYVDLDRETGHVLDYNGGSYTRDGHTGLDITLSGFEAMDRGVQVHAVADGVVLEAHDGEFDRNTDLTTLRNGDPGNYVKIDHGGGWQTWYFHLRNGSVMVHPGDHVYSGNDIGLVGSSGYSDNPHLHFEVEYRPVPTANNPSPDPVETYVDPNDYWVAPQPYSGDSFGIMNTFITDSDLLQDPGLSGMKEGGPNKTIFAQTEGSQRFFSSVVVHGLKSTDQLDAEWTSPDGRHSYTHITGQETHYGFYESYTDLYRGPQDDTTYAPWSVRWLLNGQLETDQYLGVSDPLIIERHEAPKEGGEFGLSGYGKNDAWDVQSFIPYVNNNGLFGFETIHVVRSGSVGEATVHYETLPGTALPNQDYVPTEGTLSFADGEMVKTFTVDIINSGAHQSPRSFYVQLSNATGNTDLPSWSPPGEVRIVAPDPRPAPPTMPTPKVSIDSVSVQERNFGSTDAVFFVTLDKPTNVPVMVFWGTSPADRNWQKTEGTAIAGVDYRGRYGIVTFAPGETTKTISIEVIGHWVPNKSVYFVVTLTRATGADLGANKGIGTIVGPPPDEFSMFGAPPVSKVGAIMAAGTPWTNPEEFPFTLSATSSRPETARLTTADGSDKAGTDPSPEDPLTRAPDLLSENVKVNARVDDPPDLGETFFVQAGEPDDCDPSRAGWQAGNPPSRS
jgi:murein DD-endopeptidase MepM/ murein hydrolase activator NlpD